MKTIPKPESRADWLDLRRPYVNASAAACLIRRHPWLEYVDYAVQKVTGKDVPENKAMRRGNTLESAIAKLWEDEHGMAIVPASVLYQKGPFLATPDFEPVAFDASWLLEVKSTSSYVDEYIPDFWKIQCIVQAWCAERDGVHVAVLDKSMSLKSFYVDATTDEAQFLMVTLEAAASRFLEYTREGKIPEGLDLNENAVKALFPRAEQRVVDIDAQTLSWVNELAEARDLESAAKARVRAAKDALAAVLVDANAARYGDQTVLTWRNTRDSVGVEWSALEADNPDLVDKYRRTIVGARRMLVTRAGRDAAAEMPWATAEEESF